MHHVNPINILLRSVCTARAARKILEDIDDGRASFLDDSENFAVKDDWIQYGAIGLWKGGLACFSFAREPLKRFFLNVMTIYHVNKRSIS